MADGNQTFNFSLDTVADVSGFNVSLHRRSVIENALSATILIIITLTAVIGNLAVICAIMMSHTLKEQMSNIFIINLSLTDLSSALFVMTTGIAALLGDLTYIPVHWCNFVCAANYCFIIVSMMTLACVSVDRLIAVKYSLHYNRLVTSRKIVLAILWCWFQGFIFAAAPVLKHWIHFDYWEVVCAINWYYEKSQAVMYVITACICCFLVPGIVMIYCYTILTKIAWQASRAIAHSSHAPANVQATHTSKLTKKTITSLQIVVLVFFISMTPFCLTKLLKVVLTSPYAVPGYANLSASFIGYLSSVVNPFIYGIFRKDFSQAYKKLYLKIRRSCFPESVFYPPTGSFTIQSNNASPSPNTSRSQK